MARKITQLGHAVKGALTAYITPRLAADGALKPGELETLLRAVKPAPYQEQLPLIVDSVKNTFKDRFGKDADVEDLEEVLEALQGEGDDDDDDDDDIEDSKKAKDKKAKDKKAKDKKAKDEGMSEDDAGDDDKQEAGEKLMKLLAGHDIPADDLEIMNDLICQISGAHDDEADDEADDDAKDKKAKDKKAKDKKAKDKKAKDKKDDEDDDKEVPVTKPAMDAAIKLAADAAAKTTRLQIASLFKAAEQVKPYVGDIDTLAFDSADAIYKLALDQNGIETKNVHPSAYGQLLQLIEAKSTQRQPVVATDAASVSDFEKRYSHVPARA